MFASFISRQARPAGTTTFRPTLDALEDRTVPATLPTVGLPISVDNLHSTAAGLVGDVTLAGQQAGTLTISSATTQAVSGQECPVLDLHIDPIHLNLLGLHVDTSAICLDVTATNHEGLLGGLLCDLTNATNTAGGLLNLGGILRNLSGQLNTFLGDLEGVLDNVLAQSMTLTGVLGQPVGGGAAAQQGPNACNILNLSLGPVDLDVPLLGVDVHLDNCNKGPVTVDVTATHDGLLGNLLCGLTDGLGNIGNLGGLISRLDRVIDQVGTLADRLGDLSGAATRLTHQADQLISQLERAADRVTNLAGLDQFIDRLDHAIDRLDHLVSRAA